MNEHSLRGTGRTTRMLQSAVDEALSGKHVRIVSHAYRAMDRLRGQLAQLIGDNGQFTFRTKFLMEHASGGTVELYYAMFRHDDRFDWAKRQFRAFPGTVLIDHYSLEQYDHYLIENRSAIESISGAISREELVRRINEWSEKLPEEVMPTDDCFALPDFLVGEVAFSQDKTEVYPPLKSGWYKITNKALLEMFGGNGKRDDR